MARRRLSPICLLVCCQISCMFGSRNKTHQLRELASLELPTRLEARGEGEPDGFARFSFDRTSGSFLHMGSNRPVNENFILCLWDQGHQQDAYASAKGLASERSKGITWRKDGMYEVGEGLHEINTRQHKVWLVLCDAPEKQAIAAYMVWQDTQSLAEAKRSVDAALASLGLQLPIGEYLKLARERPAKTARARRAAFQKLLDSRGLQLQIGGPIVDQGNCSYQLSQNERYGEVFLAVCALGDLPTARSFRALHGDEPKGISSWPQISWYSKGPNAWERQGDLIYTPEMEQHLQARHKDPARSYFYANTVDFPSEETETAAGQEHSFSSRNFWRALEPMQLQFAKGMLVKPID